MKNTPFIYADNAATTPVTDRVMEAMKPYFQEQFGNPSSIYRLGRETSRTLSEAREKVANTLGAKPREIFFTSGGSEADNWAIQGAAKVQGAQGKNHIITTAIEHHAVLHTVQALEKEGFEVTYLPVNADGQITANQVKAAVKENTGLVTIMYANNEIGTLQPIAEIGAFLREKGIRFHTDAVQAIGAVPVDVVADNVDMLSLSGHKIGAPKGIGALYIRQGVRIPNLIYGGGQESGKRAGTENTPYIVGLAQAMEDATANIKEKDQLLRPKAQRLMDALLELPHTRLNGHREQRLPGNVNISFEGIEGEGILLLLDNAGIAASSGSACTSGSLDPSHVLLALGLPHEIAHGSVRLSLSPDITDADVDYIITQLTNAVQRLRMMSPLWDRIIAQDQKAI